MGDAPGGVVLARGDVGVAQGVDTMLEAGRTPTSGSTAPVTVAMVAEGVAEEASRPSGGNPTPSNPLTNQSIRWKPKPPRARRKLQPSRSRPSFRRSSAGASFKTSGRPSQASWSLSE